MVNSSCFKRCLVQCQKRRGIVQRLVYGSPKPRIVVRFHVPLPSDRVKKLTFAIIIYNEKFRSYPHIRELWRESREIAPQPHREPQANVTEQAGWQQVQTNENLKQPAQINMPMNNSSKWRYILVVTSLLTFNDYYITNNSCAC